MTSTQHQVSAVARLSTYRPRERGKRSEKDKLGMQFSGEIWMRIRENLNHAETISDEVAQDIVSKIPAFISDTAIIGFVHPVFVWDLILTEQLDSGDPKDWIIAAWIAEAMSLHGWPRTGTRII